MDVKVEISEAKLKLLGHSMAKMFKLKTDRDGRYITKYGHLSALGVANSIVTTVEEMIKHTEGELLDFIKERDKEA